MNSNCIAFHLHKGNKIQFRNSSVRDEDMDILTQVNDTGNHCSSRGGGYGRLMTLGDFFNLMDMYGLVDQMTRSSTPYHVGLSYMI